MTVQPRPSYILDKNSVVLSLGCIMSVFFIKITFSYLYEKNRKRFQLFFISFVVSIFEIYELKHSLIPFCLKSSSVFPVFSSDIEIEIKGLKSFNKI